MPKSPINRWQLYVKSMDLKHAAEGYFALSTDVRLSILKLLAKAGSDGIASGEIARKLGVPSNSLSQQLAVLAAAGLVTQEREGRNVFYALDLEEIKRLIRILAVDCAGGRLKGVKIDP
jgi:ArsR family transcriptional regulator, arsenate/arsenite/antimonite-responsive transcriptional repressor